MKFICINNIGDFPEDFLFAKVDVEKYELENNIIEERRKLEDFILSLNLQDSIYLFKSKTISFSIKKGLEDSYIFYNILDQDPEGKLLEKFKSKISSMNYSLKKLTKISNVDLIDMDLEKKDLFMLKQEFYV
jgi:hypothetical protein